MASFIRDRDRWEDEGACDPAEAEDESTLYTIRRGRERG